MAHQGQRINLLPSWVIAVKSHAMLCADSLRKTREDKSRNEDGYLLRDTYFSFNSIIGKFETVVFYDLKKCGFIYCKSVLLLKSTVNALRKPISVLCLTQTENQEPRMTISFICFGTITALVTFSFVELEGNYFSPSRRKPKMINDADESLQDD